MQFKQPNCYRWIRLEKAVGANAHPLGCPTSRLGLRRDPSSPRIANLRRRMSKGAPIRIAPPLEPEKVHSPMVRPGELHRCTGLPSDDVALGPKAVIVPSEAGGGASTPTKIPVRKCARRRGHQRIHHASAPCDSPVTLSVNRAASEMILRSAKGWLGFIRCCRVVDDGAYRFERSQYLRRQSTRRA